MARIKETTDRKLCGVYVCVRVWVAMGLKLAHVLAVYWLSYYSRLISYMQHTRGERETAYNRMKLW